jgi:hypothetical protein
MHNRRRRRVPQHHLNALGSQACSRTRPRLGAKAFPADISAEQVKLWQAATTATSAINPRGEGNVQRQGHVTLTHVMTVPARLSVPVANPLTPSPFPPAPWLPSTAVDVLLRFHAAMVGGALHQPAKHCPDNAGWGCGTLALHQQ